MTDEEIIRELKNVEKKYKNKPTPTFSINISSMARSCRQHIEQLAKENKSLGERVLQLEKDKGKLNDENITYIYSNQNEKVKCCVNCLTYRKLKSGDITLTEYSLLKEEKCYRCNNYNKWELAE